MEILKFDGGKSPKNRNKLITAIAGAFFVAAVGSTFAANITINTNNTLEYGQGITSAAACDSAMSITPTNHYVNGTNSAGKFYIDTITVTDTGTTATLGLGGCINKVLKISAYDSVTGSSALFSCSITPTGYTGSPAKLQASGGISNTSNCANGTYTANTDGFTMAFTAPTTSPNIEAGRVYKLTIESSN